MDTTKKYQVQCNGNPVGSADSAEEAQSLLEELRDANKESLKARGTPQDLIDNVAAGWAVVDSATASLPPPAPAPEAAPAPPAPEPEADPVPEADPSDDA